MQKIIQFIIEEKNRFKNGLIGIMKFEGKPVFQPAVKTVILNVKKDRSKELWPF